MVLLEEREWSLCQMPVRKKKKKKENDSHALIRTQIHIIGYRQDHICYQHTDNVLRPLAGIQTLTTTDTVLSEIRAEVLSTFAPVDFEALIIETR